MISLTIDGKSVEVAEGSTVLQAAQAAGIHIPTLCHHPALKPFGGCRLCLVEVQGARTLQPSCTLPASNKMVVSTNTPQVKAARRFVLSMLFSDRNHFCPYCQVTGGDCELQNAALNEDMSHWSYPPAWNRYPVDASHPFFVVDQNRCILCRRCVQACGELVGNATLGIEERGAESMLVADTGVAFGESTCVSCGTCVSVCPTGALIERHSAYQGLEKDLTTTRSVCLGCSIGCGIQIFSRDNRIVRILGDWDATVNGGVLCKEGRFMPLEEKRERIETPLVRKNGELQPASWDEALSAAAQQLSQRNGLAAIVSTRLPVEAIALFKHIFANGLGASQVTSLEEGQFTATASQVAENLSQPFESSLEKLKQSDCVLCFDANLSEDHMVAGFFIKRNLPQGTRLILVEQNNSAWDSSAHVVLQPAAGSEIHLITGLSAALIRLGLQPGDAQQAAQDLAQASQICGISQDDLLAAAGLFGSADRPMVVCNGNSHTYRQLTQFAQQNGAGILSLKGGANSLAAAQLGLDKPFLPDGQPVYLALGDDTPSQALIERLAQTPFLAVQASFVSPLTEQADVVFPVTHWAEQEGHYLNVEGRLQAASASLTAPDGVRSNLAVLQALAERLELDTQIDWQSELFKRQMPVALA